MQRQNRVPLWFKLLYSLLCAILIPIYTYDYGLTTFLYFCDVALLTTLVAVWLESPCWRQPPPWESCSLNFSG